MTNASVTGTIQSEHAPDRPTDYAASAQARKLTLGKVVRYLFAAVFFLLSVSFVITLAFSWLIPNDFENPSPADLNLIAATFYLRTYQHFLALGLALGALGMYVTGLRKLGLISMAIALWAAWPIFSHKLSGPPVVAADVPRLRVMSANVWQHNQDVDALIAEIKRVNPDVLVVQELMPWHWKAIDKEFGKTMRYTDLPRITGIGNIWSKYPITPDPVRNPKPYAAFRAVELNFNGTPIAIYGLHLYSPGTFENIAANKKQVEHLIELTRNETRPVIIAGDLNATMLSPQMLALTGAGFTDAFEAASTEWLGLSWRSKISRLRHLGFIAGARIDYIFTSSKLQAVTFHTGNDTGSDHLPIQAELVVKK
jgi:vancomycin resistance protein VanJ